MRKKLVALSMAVLMLAVAVIGGTLAYFTDTTETKTNTFTVGNVDIDLTEPEWNKEETHNLMPGTVYAKDPTVTVSSAKGSQPAWVFMEVSMNKFNSWLRLFAITNDSANYNLFDYNVKDGQDCGEGDACQGHLNKDGLEAFFSSNAYQDAIDEWFTGVNHAEWEIMNWNDVWTSIQASWKDSSVKVINPIFGHKAVMKPGDSATLFTEIKMPADITSEQLTDSRFNTEKADWKLNITAYAIQEENVADLTTAYAALFPTAETFAFAD